MELSTVLIPWAGNAATTTTANLKPTHLGTALDNHDSSRMSDASQHVNPRGDARSRLTANQHLATLGKHDFRTSHFMLFGMFPDVLFFGNCALEMTFARPWAMDAVGSTERHFYFKPTLQSTDSVI